MFKRKKKFQMKSKDVIREATDIVVNTEDDKAAIGFLRETLPDDYPDMDLTQMNLHEATDLLPNTKRRRKTNPSDIMEEFNSFINGNTTEPGTKKKSRKRKKR